MVIKSRLVKPMKMDLIQFLTEDAGFSSIGVVTNIRKSLFCAQILTLEDLKKLTLYDLKTIKGIGEKSCEELIAAMVRNNIDCRFVRDAHRVR